MAQYAVLIYSGTCRDRAVTRDLDLAEESVQEAQAERAFLAGQVDGHARPS